MGDCGRVAIVVLMIFGCAGTHRTEEKGPSSLSSLDFSGEDYYLKAVVAYKKILDLQKELKKPHSLPERRRIEGLLDFQWEVYGRSLEKAEKALPNDLRVRMLRGAYWFLKKDYGRALSVYDSILRVKEAARVHYMRARCLLEMDRLLEAKKACERSLELSPEYRPAALLLVEIDRRIAASQH